MRRARRRRAAAAPPVLRPGGGGSGRSGLRVFGPALEKGDSDKDDSDKGDSDKVGPSLRLADFAFSALQQAGAHPGARNAPC